jgi:hypothetical protein
VKVLIYFLRSDRRRPTNGGRLDGGLVGGSLFIYAAGATGDGGCGRRAEWACCEYVHRMSTTKERPDESERETQQKKSGDVRVHYKLQATSGEQAAIYVLHASHSLLIASGYSDSRYWIMTMGAFFSNSALELVRGKWIGSRTRRK